MFKREAGGSERVETVIGKETLINGTIEGKGSFRVDGQLEGKLTTRGDVFIGESAHVQAEIRARHVTVAGHVQGHVVAEGRLEISATGNLEGDIEAAQIVINEGGVFQGQSSMRSGAAAHEERPPATPL